MEMDKSILVALIIGVALISWVASGHGKSTIDSAVDHQGRPHILKQRMNYK